MKFIVRWYWGQVFKRSQKRPDVLVWKTPFKIWDVTQSVAGASAVRSEFLLYYWGAAWLWVSHSACVLLSLLSSSCLVWRLLLNFMTAAGQCIPQQCLKFCLGLLGSGNTVLWLQGSLWVASVNQTNFTPLIPVSTIWDFLLSYKMTKCSVDHIKQQFGAFKLPKYCCVLNRNCVYWVWAVRDSLKFCVSVKNRHHIKLNILLASEIHCQRLNLMYGDELNFKVVDFTKMCAFFCFCHVNS